ncbi:DUF3087 domain-containing protein [Dasania sp. GY-MA-18]|uniref:DUF3087 domain-containing protein n=1 Tax=Dasania phycosphaerae TaxID=2950436 RepID=A0A9J6RPB9_9GAMM|nr:MULTISPECIES: DUF3087 domain-containing protein [Dasania]MCR8923436.1 DUF3087 domain-containing protein [Dasania sp. GY-MA-18]MCZ0865869.1 DUF3087 domain-containing protein [Dasania phycosphaerae]MCZ0869593.1 DUF3087 domain-containing protein [Dasania phycosphaerae]
MQFKPVDKSQYKQRYKTVGIALVAALVILALSLSTLFVALWGDANTGDNFWLNFSGVALAAFISAAILRHYKGHPYMSELSYVWDLKQELNQINRKLKKIRDAAAQGDATALLILQYYYQGCEQLWTLDDNTLVMEELKQWQAELQNWLTQFAISVDAGDYKRALLLAYK